MIDELKNLVENDIDLKDDEKFCAILGLNPSKGARSPLLWNAVFNKKSLPLKMIPLDVKQDNIHHVLTLLDNSQNFVAGALAVPYKEEAFNFFLNRLDSTVKKIGAINCLYRNNGQLTGINTDGEGAISALTSEVHRKDFEKVIVLGSGGTAKAVAAYLSPELGNVKNLVIASRNKNKGSLIADKCFGTWIDWDDIQSNINDIDLLVNCTTVGSESDIKNSPISEKQIIDVPKSAIIYDVIYQPIKTRLLEIADKNELMNLGGLKMNLEQAVIACHKGLNGSYSLEEIRNIMREVE